MIAQTPEELTTLLEAHGFAPELAAWFVALDVNIRAVSRRLDDLSQQLDNEVKNLG